MKSGANLYKNREKILPPILERRRTGDSSVLYSGRTSSKNSAEIYCPNWNLSK